MRATTRARRQPHGVLHARKRGTRRGMMAVPRGGGHGPWVCGCLCRLASMWASLERSSRPQSCENAHFPLALPHFANMLVSCAMVSLLLSCTLRSEWYRFVPSQRRCGRCERVRGWALVSFVVYSELLFRGVFPRKAVLSSLPIQLYKPTAAQLIT